MEPSEKYFEALRLTQRHHDNQTKTFSGRFTWKSRERIKTLVDQFEVKTILDYGCGKGRQYEEVDPETGQNLEQYWGVTTTKYDPGVRYYAKEPVGKFDMVICVQVLGSIPRGDLPWVVDRLYGYATKVIFVAERLIIPRKQIYKDIEKDMPFGMSRDEWRDILRNPSRISTGDDLQTVAIPNESLLESAYIDTEGEAHLKPGRTDIDDVYPKMFFAAKGEGFGWNVEEIK